MPRTDRAYVDTLRNIIDHFSEVVTASSRDLAALNTAWVRRDVHAADLAARLLAADSSEQARLAGTQAYRNTDVLRHLLSGIEAMFRMKDSAPRLIAATSASVAIAHETPCILDLKCSAWRLQGDALRVAGRLPDALTALSIAEGLARGAANAEYCAALVRYSRVMVHLELSETSRAESLLDRLTETFRQNCDDERAGRVVELEAWLLYRRRDYAAAAERWGLALAAAGSSNALNVARLTSNIARCHMMANDNDAALPMLRRVMALAVQVGDRESEASACRSIAELTDDLDGLASAKAIYDEIGYLGDSILVELQIAKREVTMRLPVDTLVQRCRSIAMRAVSCGMEARVVGELVALERMARENLLTADTFSRLEAVVPRGPFIAQNVIVN